jgi:gamma-glutamylputrescine oxidase
VIGLGGSGLAAVGEVLRRGLSVVGLDAGRVAAGAAGRNGGFLLGGPAIGVHKAATGWGLELAVDDAEAADRELELADCQAQLAVMTSHGIAAEWYSGELGEGLFLPDDAAMNPARRALGLASRYSRDARLFENSPVLSVDSGLVRTGSGSVSAGLMVVAVDGKLELLLPELADRVRTVRLQMLATSPTGPGRLPCPVYGRWGYDYAQQDALGRLYVGGGRDQDLAAEWTTDTEPTPVVQGWIDRIATRFAGVPVTVTHRWGASAGYTEDGRPIVGEVRPGVVACGGYNGTGNLVGPMAARAAVALGLDGTKPSGYFAG